MDLNQMYNLHWELCNMHADIHETLETLNVFSPEYIELKNIADTIYEAAHLASEAAYRMHAKMFP